MSNHEEAFAAESIDEQIEQLVTQSRPQLASSNQQTRLVHDLRSVCLEYTHAGDRVWTRLSSHLTRSSMASQLEGNTQSARAGRERERTMNRSHAFPSPGVPIQVRTSFRPLVAALIAVLLIGSMFWALTLATRQQTTVSSSHPLPKTSGPQFSCFGIDDPGRLAICKNHEEQAIQQSKPFGKQTLTLEAAYADASRVIIRYTLTPPAHPTPMPGLTPSERSTPSLYSLYGTQELEGKLTAQSGNTLRDEGGTIWLNSSLKQEETVESFEFDTTLPASLQMLHLHLTMKLTAFNADPAYTSSFDFSVPVHKSWIIETNQTITISGVAVTLQRVVVSPTQTRFFLSSPRLQIGGTHDPVSPTYSFTTGNKNWHARDADVRGTDLNQEAKSGPHLYSIDVYESLFDQSQKGQWTFRIAKAASSGVSSDWVFHFPVG